MIRFLDVVSFLLELSYVFIFFWILHTFLTLRKHWLIRILAFTVCNYLASVIIYPNDLANLLGALAGFVVYIVIFHCGSWIEKLSAVLVFYPALIAVNYLMMDIGKEIFYTSAGLPGGVSVEWNEELLLASTGIHTVSLLLRLLFWLGTFLGLKKYLLAVKSGLMAKMWLMIDVFMAAPCIAVFTIILFLPEESAIAYPICGASIFSSFGCIYLAAYICNAVQTAYRVQELEMRQNYLNEKVQEEERVRGIYHDMKNHLLLLQAQAEHGQEVQNSIQKLQGQIQEYENYHHTGNQFLDIILRDKARAAQEMQIDFNTVISFEDSAFIELLDISTIFGNAIDNAIEASGKLPENERLITVRANRVREMLVIVVENNALSQGMQSGNTTKKDTFLHGFGLSNIRTTVEKYGGQCSTKAADGMFTLKIMIPIP